jgi:transposase
VINKFKKGGINLITTIDSNHPISELEKHKTSISNEFTLRPPASAKEALFHIEKLTGHKRWNVLGAFNAITGQLTMVANDSYITATTVYELLHKLAKQYAGRPIVLVLDNARYQRCKLVEEVALELGLKLEWLPSYSPNLNLIERLWKFVKKKCLYNVYYETFTDFVASMVDCLERVDTDYKDELSTLIQPKFQNMKNVSLLAV